MTAERGKEYRSERREVTVGAEPVELTLRLGRWVDVHGTLLTGRAGARVVLNEVAGRTGPTVGARIVARGSREG